jgi:hypothetical protein
VLLSSLSRLRRTGGAGIDIEGLDQVEKRVVDLNRIAANVDRPLDALRWQVGFAIAEPPIEPEGSVVRDARADADLNVSPRPDKLLRRL